MPLRSIFSGNSTANDKPINKGGEEMIKNLCLCLSFSAVILLLTADPSFSRTTFKVGGKTLGVQGYISQSFQYSTKGDHWDTEQHLNAALTNLFLEADYKINSDWKIYCSGLLSVDWIYQIKHDDHTWESKQFDRSKDSLNVDDEWWQLLKEIHVTWNPGNFFLRVGKQRVGWGEMEVFAVNDLINPTDQTRGFSEIELETLFVPIPMIRADYDFDLEFGPFSSLNFQFVFNPNVDFIGNQGTFYGNDEAGIWAVDVLADFGFGPWRIGRQDVDLLDEPDDFSSDYFEYGLKLSTIIGSNTLLSVMGFYGIANTAVTTFGLALAPDSFTVFDDDGFPIINTMDVGYYPRQKYVGFALATQLPFSVKSLGGVEPVVRVEGSYQMDNRFFDFTSFDFVRSDQLVLGFNTDYKIRVPWQRQFIYFFLEAQYNKIQDYESTWDLSTNLIYRDDYTNYYAYVSTGYFRAEWEPSISWYALDDANVNIWTPGLTYYHSTSWKYALKANFFTGPDISDWGFKNKNNIVFKVTYQF